METSLQPDEISNDEPRKMGTALHGILVSLFGSHLSVYLRGKKLGHAFNCTATYNFEGKPPKRMPDYSFISLAKLPVVPDEELTVTPDLVVELISKNDTVYELDQKLMHYQEVGVTLIWVIHPVTETVQIYHLNNGLIPITVDRNEELDGETVVPGFRLPLNTFFDYVKRNED